MISYRKLRSTNWSNITPNRPSATGPVDPVDRQASVGACECKAKLHAENNFNAFQKRNEA